jgi:hypothetical protein
MKRSPSIETKGELLEQVGDFTFALIASWSGHWFIEDSAGRCDGSLQQLIPIFTRSARRAVENQANQPRGLACFHWLNPKLGMPLPRPAPEPMIRSPLKGRIFKFGLNTCISCFDCFGDL